MHQTVVKFLDYNLFRWVGATGDLFSTIVAGRCSKYLSKTLIRGLINYLQLRQIADATT